MRYDQLRITTELIPPHPNRFLGTAPEPRADLSSGSMPGSVSLPFSSVLSPPSSTTPSYQTLLPPAELEEVIVKALGKEVWSDVKSGKKDIIASCGSGMTAAILVLAMEVAGRETKVPIYDEVSLSN